MVHFVQVAVYKTDFENERADREHLAGVVETEKSKNTHNKRLSPGLHEDESKRQAQIRIVHEDYQRALRKMSELDTEIVDLKQTIDSFKRSLEEASATNTKLSEDNQVLIQQVRQYKKQSDNLRSQVDELKQANSSQVQQVCATELYAERK